MHAATAMSRTELHDAVEDGDVEGVRLILAKSTDQINTRDFQGRTPAYLAAWRGQNDILSLLVLEGADINIGKNNGATPAFIAASEGHNDTLRLLVSNGADVNRTKTNIEKDSPATVAALNGNIDCLRTLVQGEADMEYQNSFGKSPAIYLKERHDQDLEQIMLEERRKKATQQLRQSIRFADAEQIRKRVAEARKYQVPESKLNMLGWQSALHKALTDKKNASVRRDNALLKVVWQWRAHGQALKMGKVQEQLQLQALISMEAVAVRCHRIAVGMLFGRWKQAALVVAAVQVAKEQKSQQKRLRTALLRLNRKYAATSMQRCLEGYFSRRLFARAFSRWRYHIVVEQTMLELRRQAAQIMVRILGRRLLQGLVTQAWSRWQASVRESRQHAGKVAERQITLFRKKIERGRRRQAILTVYFFSQRCAAGYLQQWFTQWRYGHRVGSLQHSVLAQRLGALEALASRLKQRQGWNLWKQFAQFRRTASDKAKSRRHALVLLDRVASALLQRKAASALRKWRIEHTIPRRRVHDKAVSLLRLNNRLCHRLQLQAWFLWRRFSDTIAERQKHKDAEAAVQKAQVQEISRARRLAAMQLAARSRALDTAFLARQFARWHRAAHRGSLGVSTQRAMAPRLLFQAVQGVYLRIMRGAWRSWTSFTSHLKRQESSKTQEKLRDELAKTRRLLLETNRMVAGAMMRSTLLSMAKKIMSRGFRRWHSNVSAAKIAKSQDQELALTILDLMFRRRASARALQLLMRWKQFAANSAVAATKDQAIALLNKDLGSAAVQRERNVGLKSCLRLMQKANVRNAFCKWRSRTQKYHARIAATTQLVATLRRATARRVAFAKGSSASGAARASSMRYGGLQAAWFLWRHLINTQKLGEKLRRLEKAAQALGSLRRVVRKTVLAAERFAFSKWRSVSADRGAELKQLQASVLSRLEGLVQSRARGALGRRFGHWKTVAAVGNMETQGARLRNELQNKIFDDQRQFMLEKLNTLLDSGAPRIRRAWRQWTGASHQVNVDNAKYQVQSVLILRAAFAQSALRLQMQAFRRWSGTSAAAAAAFETATRLNRQDWELSTRRTLLRLAETWSRDGMLWAIRVWHRHIMDEKLAEQVREQRFLAVEKLETFAAKTQQRNLRSAWRSWRQLLQGAKGDEAARKLKNRFKRIKRDLRRAARGQGLGILDAVSSRLAYEAKGYAFRYWASLFVVAPRRDREQRMLRALSTISALHDRVAGPQARVRGAWVAWVHTTIASREAAMQEKFTDQSSKVAAANNARRRKIGLNHLVVVLNTALRQRVRRCFDAWIDVLDFENADRIKAQYAEAASQAARALAAAERQVEILKARTDEELIPEIEQLKALNVKQHQEAKDYFTTSLAQQKSEAMAILRTAMEAMQNMPAVPFNPPPPPSALKSKQSTKRQPAPPPRPVSAAATMVGSVANTSSAGGTTGGGGLAAARAIAARPAPPPPKRGGFMPKKESSSSGSSAKAAATDPLAVGGSTVVRPVSAPVDHAKVGGPPSPSSMRSPK